MGNSDSTLGLDNLHVDRTNCQVYNDWTLASGYLDNLPIVVFSATHPATSKKRPYMERALQASRVYRHPGLLRYIAGGVVGGGTGEVVLVMEESLPLQHCHQTMSPLQIIAGLTSIVKTLVFLHDTAGVSHNNLSTSSIFVTPDQTWKLWGLEYSCSFSDLNQRHLAQIHSFCHESALPPDDTSRIVPAYQHARDAYSFANLVEDLLMRYPAIGDVPGAEDFILLLRREAQHREWSHRPRFEALQEHALFQHTFLRMHHHLSTLLLMPDQDRDTFLSGLVSSLRQYPEAVVACSLAPALLARPVLLVPKAALAILPAVLTPTKGSKESSPGSVTGLFSESVFSDHIVHHVVELYGLHDLPIRELLLDYLPCYLHLVPEDVLKDDVLPEVLLGIQDCSEALVCRSLRALAVLVSVLGADCVVGRRRHAIFASVQPKAASSAPDQRGVPRHNLTKTSFTQQNNRKGWEDRPSPSALDDGPRSTELNGRSSPDGGEDLFSGGTSGGPGGTGVSGTGSDMNLGVVLEGQRSPGRGGSERGLQSGCDMEGLVKDSLEGKQGRNERGSSTLFSEAGHGDRGTLLSGSGSKEQNLDRFNKNPNHSMLDNTAKESPKRSLGFKKGGVGFNEIFGSNADYSDDSHPTNHKEDLVANFLRDGSPSKGKVSTKQGIGKGDVNKSLFDPETASGSVGGDSDEGADWSDWEDVNDNMRTDFTAALTSLNDIEPSIAGVMSSEGHINEAEGLGNSVLYSKDLGSRLEQSTDRLDNESSLIRDNTSSVSTAGKLETPSIVSDVSGVLHQQESSPKNTKKTLSSNANRNVPARKGLGEEFDILSIEVKKKPDIEEDWFADLAPNLNHKKFDLERLLEEANAKSKFTPESGVNVVHTTAAKTDFFSSERLERLQDDEKQHIPERKPDRDSDSGQSGGFRVPADAGCHGLRPDVGTTSRDKLLSVSDTLAQCLDGDSEGQGWDNESDGGWTDQLDFEDAGSPVKQSASEESSSVKSTGFDDLLTTVKDVGSPLEESRIEKVSSGKPVAIDDLLTAGDTLEQFDDPWNQDQSSIEDDLGGELDYVQAPQSSVPIDDLLGFGVQRTEPTSDVHDQPLQDSFVDLSEGDNKNSVLDIEQVSITGEETLDSLTQDGAATESVETSHSVGRSVSPNKTMNTSDGNGDDASASKLTSSDLLRHLDNLDSSDHR